MSQPKPRKRRVHQNLIDCMSEPIKALIVKDKLFTPGYFEIFETNVYEPLGIAPAYHPTHGRLSALAFCNTQYAVLIELGKHKQGSVSDDLRPLKDLLMRNKGLLLAFDLDLLAMALYRDLDMRIANGVDVQSTFPPSEDSRHPVDAIRAGVNKEFKIFPENIKSTFLSDMYNPEEDESCMNEVILRAWVAQRLYHIQGTETVFDQATKINTTPNALPEQHIKHLAGFNSVTHQLEQVKPQEQTHQIRSSVSGGPNLKVQSARFADRIRPLNEHQDLRLNFGNMKMTGKVADISGSKTLVSNPKSEDAGFGFRTAVSVTTIGKGGPTRAEVDKRRVLLKVLQGKIDLFGDNPWVQNLWSRTSVEEIQWPATWLPPRPPSEDGLESLKELGMNHSQISAIKYMSTQRITLVHGPPGTGKTTVIGRFVELWAKESKQPGIWLVAQSNIAVKNIAEKLFSIGFLNWRVLVSGEFMEEWHSHLYEDIKDLVIESRTFKDISLKDMQGCQVILCTLSMLSNKRISKFIRSVPLRTLIVDEASQINIADYLSVFNSFGLSLEKVSFIGDDKQLPPHGQDTIANLQSVFELPILQSFSTLLDTQYRMPPQIGAFISSAVYNDELKSNPGHPIKDLVIACQFINANGNERSVKTSFANDEEIKAVILLARHFQELGKSYCVITPYDAQRSEIERRMQTEELEWESKCFNVDSFQGNEEDFIIISLVRTQSLGFLTSRRRTNVMLTRCKKGMYVVTKQTFMDRKCGDTLVGELASAVENRIGLVDTWISMQDLENGKFEAHKLVEVVA